MLTVVILLSFASLAFTAAALVKAVIDVRRAEARKYQRWLTHGER